jgi:hypothetical protein
MDRSQPSKGLSQQVLSLYLQLDPGTAPVQPVRQFFTASGHLVSKGWPSQRDGGIDPEEMKEEMKGQHTYRRNSGLIRIGIPLSPRNLNGSHRLKSRSYQIRNLKNLLTGSPADLYLLHLLKALANR